MMKLAIQAVLLSPVIFMMQSVRADSLIGDWATQGYSARVHIAACASRPDRLCGTIVWLWDAFDSQGHAMQDRNNPSAALRTQPLIGVSILKDFRATSDHEWQDGTIYDPESGRTYKSKLALRGDDSLEVSGCVLFVCRTQIWRRAESMCRP